MRPANVADYRELARRRIPKVLFDYIDSEKEPPSM